MATLAVTYTTLSDPADKTELETDIAEIVAAVNSLNNDNIATNADIDTAKLAARDYEFLVNLTVQPTTAVQPPVSATIPIAICALPGNGTTDGVAYTVISGGWYISDDGNVAAVTTCHIELGYAAAGPNWVPVIANVSTLNITGTGSFQQSGGLTITTSSLGLDVTGTNQYFLGLFLTAIGAGALDTVHSHLDLTLKIRRTSGLR